MTDLRQQYESGLRRLRELGDCPEADDLCDDMDALWDRMSKAEREECRRFSAELNKELMNAKRP